MRNLESQHLMDHLRSYQDNFEGYSGGGETGDIPGQTGAEKREVFGGLEVLYSGSCSLHQDTILS